MNRQFVDDRRRHEHSLELAATAIDFDLASAEAGELEQHLATCTTCTRRVAALRGDARMLSRPLTLLPSPRVDAAVLAAIARRTVRPQRLLLLAAAALLVVTLIGAVAVGASLLRPPQLLPTTVVPTPNPTTVVVASPGPDASPVLAGETWGTLDFSAYTPGVLIEAATFAGTDLVGVGRGGCVPDLNDPTDCYGAAWTAATGEGWTRSPDQPDLAVGLTVASSGPSKGILDVAAGPAGIVAIGYPYDGLGPGVFGPGVWRSPDGRAWERVDLGFNAVDVNFGAIVAGPSGYVIVGRDIDFAAPAAHAAVWTSPDGITWTRAADTPGMDVGPCLDTGEEPSCGGMLGVTQTESGYVAVGQARSNAGEQSSPAAWTSIDGLTWTRSDAGLAFEGFLSSVTLGGPGLVAVGIICQPTCIDAAPGVAAISEDGSTWTFSPVAGATDLHGVANLGDGGQLFALGAPGLVPKPPAELQLWRSGDGVTWQLVPGLPSIPDAVAYGGADISAADDRLVIVGWAEVTGVDGMSNFAYVSPPAGPPSAPTDLPSPR